MRRLTRADLDALPSYVPGRTVPGAIKLASNEVPYGPLPGVIEAITEAAAGIHRYPGMGVVALREALAQRYGGPRGRARRVPRRGSRRRAGGDRRGVP